VTDEILGVRQVLGTHRIDIRLPALGAGEAPRARSGTSGSGSVVFGNSNKPGMLKLPNAPTNVKSTRDVPRVTPNAYSVVVRVDPLLELNIRSHEWRPSGFVVELGSGEE
jgi:hypothetical protein